MKLSSASSSLDAIISHIRGPLGSFHLNTYHQDRGPFAPRSAVAISPTSGRTGSTQNLQLDNFQRPTHLPLQIPQNIVDAFLKFLRLPQPRSLCCEVYLRRTTPYPSKGPGLAFVDPLSPLPNTLPSEVGDGKLEWSCLVNVQPRRT